jgi:hypothetical protein
MPNTYTLLETITVGAANATSVTFNSIPQTGYTDLVIKASARVTASGYDKRLNILFNNNSTGYTQKAVNGIGSSAGSYTSTLAGYVGSVMGASGTANSFGNTEIYIPNYTSANNKTYSVDNVNETNSANENRMDLMIGIWANTAAITSIVINTNDGTALAQYSTFSLYGVSALGTTPTKAPKATGGDIIMTDGTYWSHTFLSSGTFRPATGLTCDYLVVAGGAAGSGSNATGNSGGGGGAGGYLTSIGGSQISLSTTNYTVTVGAGGAGSQTSKSNGSNSVFSSITATGGGAGGIEGSLNGNAGGSGGGGAGGGSSGTAGTGGAASPSGQGNAGGNGVLASWWSNGGGGGAGSIGSNGTGGASRANSIGGNGGTGLANSISGSSVTYAGGGGGGGFGTFGTGGSSIGGNGSNGNGGSVAATAGVANTGSGGGGGSDGVFALTVGGNGGSGVVIIRYLA